MLKSLIQRLRNEFIREEGVTVIEYTMIAALLIVVIVATIALVGGQLQVIWDTILTQLGGS